MIPVILNTLAIDPPLLNTSCAWASELDQLDELYRSPYTGAVTVRTATLNGFQEDEGHTVGEDTFVSVQAKCC
jgi:dihydroorotate dehydrogenase (fumarate)